MNMGLIIRMVLTVIAGLIAWNIGRNIDGPIAQWTITGLVVFVVWGWSAGFAGGFGGGG